MGFRFNDLALDIIFEILGHLSIEDIVRIRHVCQRLLQASYQRSVWDTVYKRSDLFLPDGPFSSQSSSRLEALLVRATKINWTWTSPRPPIFTKRRFPRELPIYNFTADVISGRFLQLTQEDGIAWYDLDSSNIRTPVLTYPCYSVVTTSGYLKYQVNANGEGTDTAWVAFLAQSPTFRMQVHTIISQSGLYSYIGPFSVVLKLTFNTKTGPKVHLHSEIPTENLTKIIMDYDWLLLVREFEFPDEPMDLFHIPSMTNIYAPMHEQVQALADLNNLNYVISPRFLFLTFSTRNETLIEAYALPRNPEHCSHGHLIKSYSGLYPHAISNIQLVGEFSLMSNFPATWTSKIGLHLFDVTIDPAGMLVFTTQCQGMLNVGIATTTLSFSARTRSCLAVTHSTPGPVVLAHHIRREDSGYTMSVKSLKLPEGLQSRDMLAFDGFRGRVCLISGWTNIEILDCA
ncbi:hypothetical protein CPB84DRAFT_1845985 [Gymnopilus junonius]|uniref:F-box domain-containing protein n=1 Tax=Gymnopilus junonius TaxID=109634 RepID=A0A9P5TPR1_GYMJU|nr:hypothetical protein CPB84DRAFT_1845985 [Gymnopilus junonius]